MAATHVDEDGGVGNDVIVVTMPGLDINGWNGDDVICVSSGDDRYGSTIRGGNGRDSIITYSGSNAVYAGADADSLLSNSSDHVLDGGTGTTRSTWAPSSTSSCTAALATTGSWAALRVT